MGVVSRGPSRVKLVVPLRQFFHQLPGLVGGGNDNKFLPPSSSGEDCFIILRQCVYLFLSEESKGYGVFSTLNGLALRILRECELHQIVLVSQFVSGSMKVIADSLSLSI